MDEAKDPQYGLGAFYAAEARANLGLARFQAGDDARAEEDFRRALERNPSYPDLHYYVALLCERTGRPRDAAAALEQALAAAPASISRRGCCSRSCWRSSARRTRAREELERCVALGFELPPGLVARLRGAAVAARVEGPARPRASGASEADAPGRDRRRALRSRASATGRSRRSRRRRRAEPKFADVRCRLGTLLAEAGRHEEARAQFTPALAINPRYLEARTRLGLALLHLGRPRDAEAAFVDRARAGARRSPTCATSAPLAASGRATSTARRCAGAGARSPSGRDLARAHRLRALCLDGARPSRRGARFRSSEALHDGRELPQAAMDLGVLLLARGKAREAQHEFERALHWQPDTADVHFGLAQALLSGGDLEAAVERLKRCLALEPAHGPALHRLGQAHLAKGRVAEARQALEEALRDVPRYADVHQSLGQACEKAGDLVRAEQAYRDALALNANFTDARAGARGRAGAARRDRGARPVREARTYDPLHPRARAMDDRRLAELLEEGVSS